jgi:hypothetical protein
MSSKRKNSKFREALHWSSEFVRREPATLGRARRELAELIEQVQFAYLPHNYVPNTVVYTGTHDNNTTRGWFEALPEDQKRNVWNYLKRPAGNSDEVAWELIHLAWSSSAALAIAPLQDLLNLGAEARMNCPEAWKATGAGAAPTKYCPDRSWIACAA